MRTILSLLTFCILLWAAPASAGEVDIQLGGEGQLTSWEGDTVGYSTLGASYFFQPWFAVDLTTKFGIGAVDDRILEYFDLGVVFRGKFKGTRPRARLGLIHQHEVSGDALDSDFTANFFGWGDGIRHRAGVSTAVGLAIPIGMHRRGEISLVVEARANRFIDENEGPGWNWGMGVAFEFSFLHKAKRLQYAD